ncbi:MAG TPA: TIGR00725 family protein [Chitinophagales bacterium]|nr:TIGR00725 family protein [Chitinophagales bacterium]
MRPKIISVIGPNAPGCTPVIYDFGVMLGKTLIDEGYFIVCGGMGGLMEAVCKGATKAKHYTKGCTIGILPTLQKSDANEFCDVVIPSGLGIARNQLVVNAGDAVVAIGGGAGTLSEIAFAWQLGKPLICYSGLGGWSEAMAGKMVDERMRNKIIGAESLEEIIAHVKRVLQ